MREFVVTLTAKETFTEEEIVNGVNDFFDTNYLTVSDIPKDMVREYFQNSLEFFDLSNKVEVSYKWK